MTIEDEIRLLKEKVALLEKVKELQEMIAKVEPEKVYVPYPVHPTYPTRHWITAPYPVWIYVPYPGHPQTTAPYPWNPMITWTTSGSNCHYTTGSPKMNTTY